MLIERLVLVIGAERFPTDYIIIFYFRVYNIEHRYSIIIRRRVDFCILRVLVKFQIMPSEYIV